MTQAPPGRENTGTSSAKLDEPEAAEHGWDAGFYRRKRNLFELKTYLKYEPACAAEVRRIALPLLDLEAAKKRRPVRRTKTVKRRAVSNVVEGRLPLRCGCLTRKGAHLVDGNLRRSLVHQEAGR